MNASNTESEKKSEQKNEKKKDRIEKQNITKQHLF